MAVNKIQDDWQITPTTATENAEAQKAMAAKPQETTETTEAETTTTAPASYMDALTQVWSPRLQTGAARVASAVQSMTALDKERKEAMDKLAKARENETSVWQSVLEEEKPVRKEDEEKMLRNRALIKGFGDVASAIASGVHAYGKRGAGVVPTLADNSPLKDIEKLNALREEYLKRKEAWKALDMKLRMADADDKSTEAKEAYKSALERMKDAQKVYQDALDDYDTLARDFTKDQTRAMDTERKEDRADARERYVQGNLNYRASLDGKGKVEEVTDVEILDELFPWKPKVNKTARYDAFGNLEGYSKTRSTYSKAEREAEARGNEYVRAVQDLMKNEGLSKEEAVAIVKAIIDEDMRQASESLHNVARGGKK